jgi:pantetheine-phosphate adenylyltransferase
MADKKNMKIAVYPGTFDPITNGHLDIIQRASLIFDKIIVAVSDNRRKNPLFSLEERKTLIETSISDLNNVTVQIFKDLLVRFAERQGAYAIIRGLRAVSDFDYEFQIALMNRKLMPKLETVYLMPSEEYTYINSTIVKEVASLVGNMSCFLPAPVAKALTMKINTEGQIDKNG